jgi:hypothetical protein
MLFVVAVVGAILALPGVSAAQVSQDSVSGGGVASAGLGFSLDARSGPSGENPTGTARVRQLALPDIALEGQVTCLTVTGNRGVIGIEDTLGLFGRGWFIQVTDGTPDTFNLSPFSPVEAPTVCPASLDLFGGPVFVGDIIVVDAPALPTSMEQCKDGGWQSYGVFKNQGDCVSFVATGGKNPPGKNGG